MNASKYRAIAIAVTAILATAAHAEVKIGFLGTFSGAAAALGQDQYDGFMLALEQKGGKLGGAAVKIVKEDDQLKPDLGVQLVRKLIESDKVDLVTGVTFSNVMMAVAKPLAAAEMLFVGSNAGPAPLAGKDCNANFFFTSFQNDNQAEVLGKYAADKGYKKMMLLAPNYQSGRDQVAGFKRYYKGSVAAEVFTQLNQPDYSAELAQVQAVQPDAIFAFFPGGMGVNFVKQMNQAGLLKKMPVLTVSTTDGTTLPALKDDALGVLAGAAWGPDLPNPANKAFVAAFEQKYKRIPSQYAAQGFDAALAIDSALTKTKGSAADKAALRGALRAADFAAVVGGLKFNHNGFPIQDQHVFQVAKDAQGRVSLKTVATPLPALRDAYSGECALK
ncbi:MAG: ABC transporter substrate-binding protein [Rubrivivax sp.]|nr:ABC transporter substrate-binding protein [Rubrivivax sp.]MCL4696779.1 ABC transporter substrate-binding protein [Burkholderiaceae bacterium]